MAKFMARLCEFKGSLSNLVRLGCPSGKVFADTHEDLGSIPSDEELNQTKIRPKVTVCTKSLAVETERQCVQEALSEGKD